jgi:uncharacterized protein
MQQNRKDDGETEENPTHHSSLDPDTLPRCLIAWTCRQIPPISVSFSAKGIVNVTISMHQASVGVFTHFLNSLSDLLDLAAAHAENRKIDPAILLNARLYPNMYNLIRQVGEANRHAVTACALLAGIDPPAFSEAEPDIAELKARIATAKDFMANIPASQIDGTEEKGIVFTFRNGRTRQFTGQSLLLTFSVPQFFFHVTTAYDILRHCGVELAKRDFLGKPDQAVRRA